MMRLAFPAWLRFGHRALIMLALATPVSLQAQAAGPSASSSAPAGPRQAQQMHAASRDDAYSQAVRAAVEAYNRDDFQAARAYFAQAHQRRPSARTWRGLGTTAFELKLYDDAVRELTFALEDQRNALPTELRAETELTLRVAQRRLDASGGAQTSRPQVTAEPSPSVIEATESAGGSNTPAASGLLIGPQRVAAVVTGAAGVVGLAIGAGFGLRSIAKGNERDKCPLADQQASTCPPAAVDASIAAVHAGNIATVSMILGGAAVAAGIVMWVTGAPDERPPHQAANLVLGPGTVLLRASF